MNRVFFAMLAKFGQWLQLRHALTAKKTLFIVPEALPATEDVKKVERRLIAEKKKSLKKPDAL